MSVTHSRELDSASSKRATFSVGSRLLPSGCGGRNPAAWFLAVGIPKEETEMVDLEELEMADLGETDMFDFERPTSKAASTKAASMKAASTARATTRASTLRVPLRRPRSRRDRSRVGRLRDLGPGSGPLPGPSYQQGDSHHLPRLPGRY